MNVFKNFLYNAGYQLLIIIVPFILSPYVSRIFGPEGVGTYSYTYSITALIALFANLGVLKYGNREISRYKNDREKCSLIFAELMSIKIVCGILTFSVFLFYIRFFAGEYKTAFAAQLPVLLSCVIDVSWLFWGMQEFRLTAAASGVIKVISIGFVFAFVKTENDVAVYIFIQGSSTLLIQVVLGFFVRRYVNLKISVRYLLNRHWKSMILLFFPVLARFLYTSMDKIMIGGMAGTAEAGHYENVQSITVTALQILTALGDVIMPQMTRYFMSRRTDEAHRLFNAAFHLVTFFAVGIMFAFISIAEVFIPWFYGEKFAESIPLLQAIAPLVLLSGYSDLIRNAFLLPRYRDREYITALTAGAAVNFTINYMLIPQMKSMGAVIGTLAAEALVLGIQLWYVRSEIDMRYLFRRVCAYCVPGAVIFFSSRVVSALVTGSTAQIVADVAVGGLLYTGFSVMYLKLFEKEIFEMLRNLLHHIKLGIRKGE